MSELSNVLIVTLFGRGNGSRYTEALTLNPEAGMTRLADLVATALLSVLGGPSLTDKHLLSPTVCRFIYQLHHPISLDKFRSMRRQPSFTQFFTQFEPIIPCEIVLDLVPPPSSHHEPNLDLYIPNPRFKLALFDMDSTLINQEVIDELARANGLMPAVSAITSRAMNGEIDFSQSLIQRVRLLKGIRADIWDTMKTDGSITIAPGARELVSALRARGVKTAVVSGGFAPMANWLKDQLGLDYAFANELLVSRATDEHPYEHLSGEVNLALGIVDAEEKRKVLLRLAEKEGVDLAETIAVGDGSNDLLMMGAAGLGVAWRAKTKVQEAAPARLNGESLEELLWLWGDRDADRGKAGNSSP